MYIQTQLFWELIGCRAHGHTSSLPLSRVRSPEGGPGTASSGILAAQNVRGPNLNGNREESLTR
jgi:hypothetical protein